MNNNFTTVSKSQIPEYEHTSKWVKALDELPSDQAMRFEIASNKERNNPCVGC